MKRGGIMNKVMLEKLAWRVLKDEGASGAKCLGKNNGGKERVGLCLLRNRDLLRFGRELYGGWSFLYWEHDGGWGMGRASHLGQMFSLRRQP